MNIDKGINILESILEFILNSFAWIIRHWYLFVPLAILYYSLRWWFKKQIKEEKEETNENHQ